MSATVAPPVVPPPARQKRAQQPALGQWRVAALAPQLPLRWPGAPAPPPSPKRRYRSQYRPPDPTALPAPQALRALSDVEVACALIDFGPLEPALSAHYRRSAKGQVPFHPVSLFLACGLRRELGLGWGRLAQLLAHEEHGAGWRRVCGFTGGQTPSASGLRYFFQRVDPAVFEALCPQAITLLRQHGLFPERSTYPGDPPDRGIPVTQDGQLHPARQRPRCASVTDTCYQPRPPAPVGAPAGEPGRPCPARAHGHEGCRCTTPACAARCVRANRLDPEARLIRYAARPRPAPPAGAPAAAARPPRLRAGPVVFGYRSVAERALDDRFAVAWTLRSGVYPATADERTLFVPRLRALQGTFPDLRIGEWLGDAGVGYEECLDAVWQLGALRLIELRAAPSDQDRAACVQRGYDGHGWPLCPHGYRLRANGHDAPRRRTKYVCAQACRREPPQPAAPVRPVAGCPYLDRARPAGYVVNVGRTLPDGARRLAREIPHGSAAWHARYGRRNLAESRNGQLEGLGLKRLPCHGLPRATKEIQLADWLLNLRTLGRLVREASTGPPA
jgi:hypothetical protein